MISNGILSSDDSNWILSSDDSNWDSESDDSNWILTLMILIGF